jgi:hypothetical protein
MATRMKTSQIVKNLLTALKKVLRTMLTLFQLNGKFCIFLPKISLIFFTKFPFPYHIFVHCLSGVLYLYSLPGERTELVTSLQILLSNVAGIYQFPTSFYRTCLIRFGLIALIIQFREQNKFTFRMF